MIIQFDNLIGPDGKQIEMEYNGPLADLDKSKRAGEHGGRQLKALLAKGPLKESEENIVKLHEACVIGGMTQTKLNMLLTPMEDGKLSKENTIELLNYLIDIFDDVNAKLDYLFSKHREDSFKFNDSQKRLDEE